MADRAVTRLDDAAGAVAALPRHDHATGRRRPSGQPDNRVDTGGQS